jgi:hypothetical protein
VGTASESVVHVTVSLQDPKTGLAEQREGSGVLIRCDGYVLVPTALMANGKDRGVPGQRRNNEIRFPQRRAPEVTPRAQEIANIPFFSEKRGYAVAKLREVHSPCLPLLHAKNIRSGMQVDVVWARRDSSKPGAVVVETVEAVVGKRSGDRPVWLFDAKAKLPTILPGAAVVDKASGLAIGIVPGTQRFGDSPSAARGFADFTDLYYNTNAVGLVPSPTKFTREQQQPEAGSKRDGMIWIPGGEAPPQEPVLPTVLVRPPDKPACTPGFWIDERPVTNEEYERYLAATGDQRRPRGWALMDRAGYPRQGGLPVQGVTHDDAAAYAEWAGKRLVTPTEWDRASKGRLNNYWRDTWRAAKAAASLRLRDAYLDMPGNTRADIRQQIAAFERNTELPPPAKMKSGFVGLEASGGEFAAFAVPVERHFGYPTVIVPAGVRESDRSDFGVLDVALNPGECLLVNRSAGIRPGTPKLKIIGLILREDIFADWRSILTLSYVHGALTVGTILGGDGRPITARTPGHVYHGYPVTETSPPAWRAVFGRHQFHPIFEVSSPWPPLAAVEWGITGPTFRCAR